MPRNLMVDQNGDLGVLDFRTRSMAPVMTSPTTMRDAFLSWEEFVLDITDTLLAAPGIDLPIGR
jgi:aminoglycoside/choline kinase family phosphotransferase